MKFLKQQIRLVLAVRKMFLEFLAIHTVQDSGVGCPPAHFSKTEKWGTPVFSLSALI